MNSVKVVKKLISLRLTNRKEGVSVRLGESDDTMDRIEINFPAGGYLTFNGINTLLKSENFQVTQIINFYYPKKQTALLIRYKK